MAGVQQTERFTLHVMKFKLETLKINVVLASPNKWQTWEEGFQAERTWSGQISGWCYGITYRNWMTDSTSVTCLGRNSKEIRNFSVKFQNTPTLENRRMWKSQKVWLKKPEDNRGETISRGAEDWGVWRSSSQVNKKLCCSAVPENTDWWDTIGLEWDGTPLAWSVDVLGEVVSVGKCGQKL